MKTNIILSVTLAACLSMASCGGGGEGSQTGQGKKFAPKERESSMTDSERKDAIAAKKESLKVDVNSLMNSNGVKLSVLPPTPSGDITEAVSEKIGGKMLGIIASNGIGGVNNVPGFALAASVSETGRQLTGSAPQKSMVKYAVSYQVINVADGNVYGSATETVTGVGDSFAEAAAKAFDELGGDNGVSEMLASSSEKIIGWYNDNLPTLKAQVGQALGAEDFALALAYLNSVPSQAKEAYAYANATLPEVTRKFKIQRANEELSALKKAIADGRQKDAILPDVYTHLALLPADSPEYAQAVKMVEQYEKQVYANQAAANAQKVTEEEARQAHERQLELAKLEADKVVAVAQAKASEQAMRQHMRDKDDKNRGFWGKLGARIIEKIDQISDAE